MSDRYVFITAFLTVVLIVGSAFTVPTMFWLQLLESSMFLLISLLVFFGEDKFSYMLGMMVPVLWYVVDALLGRLRSDFGTLLRWVGARGLGTSESPLYGLAMLTQIVLVLVSARVWRKQVTEKFFGKTFGLCLIISAVYFGLIAAWYFRSSAR
jgi:hypothetical protein